MVVEKTVVLSSDVESVVLARVLLKVVDMVAKDELVMLEDRLADDSIVVG